MDSFWFNLKHSHCTSHACLKLSFILHCIEAAIMLKFWYYNVLSYSVFKDVQTVTAIDTSYIPTYRQLQIHID